MRSVLKQAIDRLPQPIPELARTLYRRVNGPREIGRQLSQPIPLFDFDHARLREVLSERRGAIHFIAAPDDADAQYAILGDALAGRGVVALAGDLPQVTEWSARLNARGVTREVLPLQAFNDLFRLRERNDVDSVLLLCSDALIPKWLRALAHTVRFTGEVVVPATNDAVWPTLAFEKPRPIMQCAYPCAGTNRFTPVFLNLLDRLKWENSWFSPFMRNVHVIQAAQTADGYRVPGIVEADESIFWRARSLDHTQCLTIHEWVSLRRMVSLDCSIVALMRDPRDIINSYFWHTRNETTDSAETHLLRIIEGYTRFHFGEPAYAFNWPRADLLVDSYLVAQQSPNMHIIRFEDMHSDALSAMRRLMMGLGLDPHPLTTLDNRAYNDAIHLGSFEYQTGGRRRRGEDHKDRPGGEHSGISARKGSVGDWRSSFTPAAVRRFKELTGDALIRLGYEADAGWDL